jgi:hypothetical protein
MASLRRPKCVHQPDQRHRVLPTIFQQCLPLLLAFGFAPAASHQPFPSHARFRAIRNLHTVMSGRSARTAIKQKIKWQ